MLPKKFMMPKKNYAACCPKSMMPKKVHDAQRIDDAKKFKKFA